MFRFNRIFFIISNYLITFFCFLIIFNIRYSWVRVVGIVKRELVLSTIILFAFYSLTIIIFNISLKIYEINKISRITESILLNIFISIISMGIFGIYFYFTQTNFARFVFFLGFLIIPFILSFYNKFLFMIISKKKKPYKILYFGSNHNFQLFKELINQYSKWFSMKIEKVQMTEHHNILKKKINQCDLLVVDTDQNFKKEYIKILNSYEIEGGKIYSLIDMFSYFDQSLPAEIIKNNHYDLFSSYKIDSFYNQYLKRIGDVFISIFLLIILSPLIIIIMLLIKITSRGKIFFSQKRITLRGKTFNMYKFRSMKTLAEKNGIQFTKENDARITFIGKIIRPLRIDELPQLINILMGDMSFIGPRPERPELIEKIIKKCPLFKKRLLIKPGLSGWAQVKYTYVNKIEKMNKKLSYDLFYINNHSAIFDLKILLYTIETIIFRRGAM